MSGAGLVVWHPSADDDAAHAPLRRELTGRGLEVLADASLDEMRARVEAAVDAGAELVVAAGGDGTVRAVVSALHAARSRVADGGGAPALAVLPLGTGNDLARHLGLDASVGAALLDGPRRPLDLVEARLAGGSTEVFANVACLGNSPRIHDVLTDEQKARWGAFSYLRGAVEVITDLDVFDVAGTLAGGGEARWAMWNLIVANGAFAGGGLHVAPGAASDDGEVDVLVVRGGEASDVLGLSAQSLAGMNLRDAAQVTHFRTSGLRLRCERPCPCTLDGDLVGPVVEIAFEVLRGALEVVVGGEEASAS